MSLMRTNPTAWGKLRKQVLRRDSYSCQLRLQACTQWATQVDHVVPRYAGGSDDLSNLQAACRNCNLLKGAGFFRQQTSLDASQPEISPLQPISGDYTRRHSR